MEVADNDDVADNDVDIASDKKSPSTRQRPHLSARIEFSASFISRASGELLKARGLGRERARVRVVWEAKILMIALGLRHQKQQRAFRSMRRARFFEFAAPGARLLLSVDGNAEMERKSLRSR